MSQKSNDMLETIMDRRNIEKALLQVERNKGVGGVDGMQPDKLRDYLNTNYQQLRKEVIAGIYKPSPVEKVEIPKPQGGVRMLGIPKLLSYYFITVSCRYVFAITNIKIGFHIPVE